MSFTLEISTNKKSFRFSLSRRQLLAAIVLTLAMTFIIAARGTDPLSDGAQRVMYTQTGLRQQQQEIEQLKQTTEEQLTGMLVKMGEMQGQLLRLNALGEKLVAGSNLNPQEFNFSDLPATGGPTHELANLDLASADNLISRMDNMLAELDNKTRQLQVLESVLRHHHIESQSAITGRPINSGWLSSYYGVRKDPFSGMPAMHKGIDFAGSEGDDVVATGAGLVTWAGERYGYGNLVEIEHGNGLITRYGHNKSLEVHVGDVVTKGQVIGVMGSTGRSTGPHVHYEVLKKGKQIDPLPFVYRKG
ncbi:M23 family metallopeptidase [Lacimicrobium alkaliphilum]|uniref:Peptidase M23 n=1 Tax=Lacimicrobium alkaliphilum TaxID=1526571 RepID=A0ABQ1QXH4_9ALTE|nr:M23 family metallopeptidase [Lacimicrobium alkaliphilum]GGD50886.1 peptidase M23 [Lacimicrobium alkaliphilum]